MERTSIKNMQKMFQKLDYREKFRIMDREAAATLALAVIIMAFFWLAVFLLKDSAETLLAMPLWFTVSCIGGYLLSIAGVIFLVRRFFKDFDLGEEQETQKEPRS
ncbi:MAG: YhdT family protein [Mesosutterella sp.]|nr:YhdT family protein [Mesosutterella sp.]